MKITAIYAISENRVIGNANELPWKLSADLQYFKQLTLNKPIIMGRKTWDSLGKPLPKRRNIVISRHEGASVKGVEWVNSVEKALEICANEAEVFIIGGAQILKDAFEKDLITEIRQTMVHADVEGDVTLSFPDESRWQIINVDAQQADEKNEFAYTFLTLTKKA